LPAAYAGHNPSWILENVRIEFQYKNHTLYALIAEDTVFLKIGFNGCPSFENWGSVVQTAH